jgi:hypothetical protein
MHHTDSIDFIAILTGSVELLLDDGVHLLEAGDCVVQTGIDHGWQPGPDGYTFLATIIGTPPPT